MILLLRKCKKHKGLKDKGRLKKNDIRFGAQLCIYGFR